MKIEGPGPVRTGTVRRTGKAAKKGDEVFMPESHGEETAAAPVAGAGPLAAVEALLPLQEVPDATSAPSRGLAHGNDMLDRLEDIRLGLLAGSIPRHQLDQLVRMVEQRRKEFIEPHLAMILDEIELRARVELAKLKVHP